MKWWRLLGWIATATALVLICSYAPRLLPDGERDPLPTRVGLDEPARIAGGTVTVDRVRVAPDWTDGETSLSLGKDGYFVEVLSRARPDQRATSLRARIRSDGRTYTPSDRVGPGSDPAPAGFSSPQLITFEVPADVLDQVTTRDKDSKRARGSVWVSLADGSAARLALTADTVERIDVLEQDR